MKAAGPILLGGRPLPARLAAVVALLPAAVFAALVLVEHLRRGRRARPRRPRRRRRGGGRRRLAPGALPRRRRRGRGRHRPGQGTARRMTTWAMPASSNSGALGRVARPRVEVAHRDLGVELDLARRPAAAASAWAASSSRAPRPRPRAARFDRHALERHAAPAAARAGRSRPRPRRGRRPPGGVAVASRASRSSSSGTPCSSQNTAPPQLERGRQVGSARGAGSLPSRAGQAGFAGVGCRPCGPQGRTGCERGANDSTAHDGVAPRGGGPRASGRSRQDAATTIAAEGTSES